MLKEIKNFGKTQRFVLTIYDDYSVAVFQILDNTKEGLRNLSEAHNFSYETQWNTRFFGKRVIEHFKGTDKIVVGDYFVLRQKDESILCAKLFEGNTKEGIRQIANEVDFEYDTNWTTQQFASHLIKKINSETTKNTSEKQKNLLKKWIEKIKRIFNI